MFCHAQGMRSDIPRLSDNQHSGLKPPRLEKHLGNKYEPLGTHWFNKLHFMFNSYIQLTLNGIDSNPNNNVVVLAFYVKLPFPIIVVGMYAVC